MNKGSSLYKVVGCLLGIDDPDEFGSEANGLSEAELVSIVSSSCLVPVLESVLSGASFTDMSSRCTPSLHPECIMHAILVHRGNFSAILKTAGCNPVLTAVVLGQGEVLHRHPSRCLLPVPPAHSPPALCVPDASRSR